jgi:hypothetical protein
MYVTVFILNNISIMEVLKVEFDRLRIYSNNGA